MALGDIKTAILAFVNEALNTNFSGSDLDIAICACLSDMSNEDLLVAQDTSQSLTSTSLTLAYPTNYRSVISIVLISSGGVRQKPLMELPGGYDEYGQLRDNDANTGITEWYAEHKDLFHLWRPPNGSFSTEIDYYRDHPQTPDSILFGEGFRNAIYFGTTFFKALLSQRETDVARWGPMYAVEKRNRSLAAPETPRITRG